MAQKSVALAEFNRLKQELLELLHLDPKKLATARQYFDLLKDILVQSELDGAILKGNLEAYNKLIEFKSIAATTTEVIPTSAIVSTGGIVPSKIASAPPQDTENFSISENFVPSAGTSTNKTPEQEPTADTVLQAPAPEDFSRNSKRRKQRVSSRVSTRSRSKHSRSNRTYAEAVGTQSRSTARHSGNLREDPASTLPGSKVRGRARRTSSSRNKKQRIQIDNSGAPPKTPENRFGAVTAAEHRSEPSLPKPRAKSVGTVIVRPTEKRISGQEIREKLAKHFDIQPQSFEIRKLYAGKNHLVVKVPTLEQADKLLSAINSSDIQGITAILPTPRSTQLIIFSVPVAIQGDNIGKAITAAYPNLDLSSLRVRSCFQGKGDTKHWIVDVLPSTAEDILKKRRICLGFFSCFIKRFATIQRCYACQRFGHVSSSCTYPARCVDCGGEHEADPHSPCLSSTLCINCARHNSEFKTSWPTDHPAKDGSCRVYREALAKARGEKGYPTPQQEEIKGTPKVIARELKGARILSRTLSPCRDHQDEEQTLAVAELQESQILRTPFTVEPLVIPETQIAEHQVERMTKDLGSPPPPSLMKPLSIPENLEENAAPTPPTLLRSVPRYATRSRSQVRESVQQHQTAIPLTPAQEH